MTAQKRDPTPSNTFFCLNCRFFQGTPFRPKANSRAELLHALVGALVDVLVPPQGELGTSVRGVT